MCLADSVRGLAVQLFGGVMTSPVRSQLSRDSGVWRGVRLAVWVCGCRTGVALRVSPWCSDGECSLCGHVSQPKRLQLPLRRVCEGAVA